MKKIFALLLLATITVAAYADKNIKVADTTAQIKEQPQSVAEQQQPLHFNERMYDARMGRHGYIEPDSADIVKYGITRPTMPEKKDKTIK